MQLRQVQAHEAPRDRVREVRRRGHPVQGASRAPRPHQPGHAGRAHLVPEVAALAHRQPARHHAQGPGEGPLLRVVRRRRPEGDGPAAWRAPHRGALHQGRRGVRRGRLRRRHGRRGDPRPAQVHRHPLALRAAARRDEGSDQRGQAQEAVQAPQGRRRVPRVGQQARVDDAGRDPGDPAGSPSAGAPRRRPLRDLRSQRPLPPRDQPEQPAQAAPGAQRSRDHHPQREADAAGGGRRPVRQRPPRQDHHRPQQAAAEVALRHAEGQAGAVPPEPPRQARRLLGPFGHRRGPRAEAAPVRPAEEDGARAVQAVHLQQARGARPRHHHQERQEAGREGASRGVGHPRRGHQGAPDSLESRADAAPPGHPGLRAAAHRGQGHPAAPAGLRGVQRRLRR